MGKPDDKFDRLLEAMVHGGPPSVRKKAQRLEDERQQQQSAEERPEKS